MPKTKNRRGYDKFAESIEEGVSFAYIIKHNRNYKIINKKSPYTTSQKVRIQLHSYIRTNK